MRSHLFTLEFLRTTLKKISIKDGVCDVDLSGEFNNTLDSCMDMVTIYSIVNSLSELSSVSRVQITVNGDQNVTFRETIPLGAMFERNLDYIGGT